MVEEQPSCIIGNVAISTTLHLAPNDIGAFTDTDELRILMESARSHGYFSPPPLENREYLIEEPIGVAVSDTSQPDYLTLRLDCHPEHHIIGRPGMKIMLVLADALRLIGLSTPQSIDVECVYFNPHDWDLLNPDPDDHMHMIGTLSNEICRWMSPHLTHTGTPPPHISPSTLTSCAPPSAAGSHQTLNILGQDTHLASTKKPSTGTCLTTSQPWADCLISSPFFRANHHNTSTPPQVNKKSHPGESITNTEIAIEGPGVRCS